jgi:hypothetical protein
LIEKAERLIGCAKNEDRSLNFAGKRCLMANENCIRASIASAALAETSKGVAASMRDPADPTKRKGWERLLDYFHNAAPGVWHDADITKFQGDIPDWCGIFALWAIKAGGVSWVGTWRQGHGIASVSGMVPTNSPLPGDIGAVKESPQHMDIVYSVTNNTILTVDGNSTNGGVTGPSGPKFVTSFTAGFFTAFPSPVGTWSVQVGAWAWIYTFNKDGTAKWSDIRHPPTQSGAGKWEKANTLEISWDNGSREQWELPLKFSGQHGNLVGQGRIVTANKIR